MAVQIVLSVGLSCLCMQLILTVCFKHLIVGIWSREPAFVAHQVIALPFMVYLAFVGGSAWFDGLSVPRSVDERVHGTNGAGETIASILVGMMVFWDIPSCIFISSLKSPLMLAHHVAVAIGGIFVTTTPYLLFYVPFYGGLTELSSALSYQIVTL